MKKGKLQIDDILVVKDGATTGKVGYFNERSPFKKGAVNEHVFIFRIKDRSKILPTYLYNLVKSEHGQAEILKFKVDGGIGGINLSIKKAKIPLPPLEIQEQIVTELESYQKIIDGARQIVENYKPTFKIDPSWEIVKLEKACNIRTGKLNANAAVRDGKYPFFTCSKEVFKIDNYAFDCEAILLSGNNASGNFDVKHFKGKFNAYQRTYVITIKENYLSKFNYVLLRIILENSLELFKKQSIGGLTRYLRLDMINSINIPLPPVHIQQQMTKNFENEQKIIDANKELIKIYEQKIKDKIADLWNE